MDVEPQVEGEVTKHAGPPERLHVVPCTAALDVDQAAVRHVSALLAAERRRIGTPARSHALTCYKQAVLLLRWFRADTAIDALARDNRIWCATGYRYVDEGIAVRMERQKLLHDDLNPAGRPALRRPCFCGHFRRRR